MYSSTPQLLHSSWAFIGFGLVLLLLIFSPMLVMLIGCWWRARFKELSAPWQPRRRCRRAECGCSNPASARFCRRCGQAMLPEIPFGTAA